MKVAFDEHVPIILAQAFKALDGEEKILRVEIVSARDYAVPNSCEGIEMNRNTTATAPDWRAAFDLLQARINQKFDNLHAETAAKFRTLTRSVGQRLRARPSHG